MVSPMSAARPLQLDCPPLRDQESNLDLGDMNPAGYRYPIPQLVMKGTWLQADAPARI